MSPTSNRSDAEAKHPNETEPEETVAAAESGPADELSEPGESREGPAEPAEEPRHLPEATAEDDPAPADIEAAPSALDPAPPAEAEAPALADEAAAAPAESDGGEASPLPGGDLSDGEVEPGPAFAAAAVEDADGSEPPAGALGEPAAEAVEAAAAEVSEADGAAVDDDDAEAAPLEGPAAAGADAAVASAGTEVPPAGTEVVYPVREERKRALLLAFLEQGGIDKAVIFTRTKHRANRLTEWLAKRGITVDRVHTQRSHRQRRDAMTGFCEGGVRVLVVAGRASRLLELTVPATIVHLDVPETLTDYRERVGAAPPGGEAGGGSLLFVGDVDEPGIQVIEEGLGRELPRLTLEGFDYEVPLPAVIPGAAEPVAHIGDRRPRSKSRGARRRRRGEAPQPGNVAPPVRAAETANVDSETAEDARIRALAEAQQAAAVAARMNPSRMGIMEWRDGRQAGGGRSNRRQAHRGHQPP